MIYARVLNRDEDRDEIAREDLIKQVERNGFRLAKKHTFLPYHYFLVFVPR
jgi:hypothetical protein